MSTVFPKRKTVLYSNKIFLFLFAIMEHGQDASLEIPQDILEEVVICVVGSGFSAGEQGSKEVDCFRQVLIVVLKRCLLMEREADN